MEIVWSSRIKIDSKLSLKLPLIIFEVQLKKIVLNKLLIRMSLLSMKFTNAWIYCIRYSIVVSMPACHAGDPGSIPGGGVF